MPVVHAPASVEHAADTAATEDATATTTDDNEPAPYAETLREHSRKLIEETLAVHGGNVSQAARQLNVSRGTLYRRLRGWREGDAPAED
jgi:DNA-binding NtrC family response regulator